MGKASFPAIGRREKRIEIGWSTYGDGLDLPAPLVTVGKKEHRTPEIQGASAGFSPSFAQLQIVRLDGLIVGQHCYNSVSGQKPLTKLGGLQCGNTPA